MISPQQKKILAFPYSKYDAIICDGAVRSGKTSIMMWAFVRWAMENFSGQRFGICGKTVDSCSKNIIVPFTAMTLAKEKYTMRWRRSEKILEVRRGTTTNWFEVFGGKDESSAATQIMPGAIRASSCGSGPILSGKRVITIRKNHSGLAISALWRNATRSSRRKMRQNIMRPSFASVKCGEFYFQQR